MEWKVEMASSMAILLITSKCFEPEHNAALHATQTHKVHHRAQLLLSARTLMSMYYCVGQNSTMKEYATLFERMPT